MRTEIGKITKKGWLAGSRLAFAMMFTVALFLAFQTNCFATSVVLQWNPSTDPGVAGYKVYYQADSAAQPYQGSGATQGSAPLNALNQTTATISGLDPNHAYYFAVTAYNASGVESPYSNVVSAPELVPPTTTISSPANNATVSGTVSVAASASDNVGVTKVEFYVNGILQASDTSTPYVFSWNTSSLAPGTYTLMTKAYDAAGNVGQSNNVAVTVANDTTVPTVSLTAPVNSSILSGTVAIAASASDNVGVSKVEFYANGVLLSATNVAPYSYSWNTTTVANGSYTLTAKAYDASNNIGQSTAVSVTVNNPVADTTLPVVSLSAPTNNATVSGTVSVNATASDNVGVSKVEFYVNNVLKATDTASPYSYSWDTTTAANGTFTLTAKAYDAAGNVGQSSVVSVTVNNTVVSPTSFSIWPTTSVPVVNDQGPDSPVEVGVKFRSDSNGYITGIRFYKASTNTGTHVGNLWTSTGTRLATATFTNETASGWQQVNFATPVAITSNTIYVASYFTNVGHYSDDANYFTGKGVDNPPLHALADGVSGANGVYAYGTSSIFPNLGYMGSNYWVDVVFSSTTGSNDTTLPSVSISSPVANATVSGTTNVTVSASDNVGVTKVEFYVNGVLQATDTASPYTFSWNTATATNGSYTLSAKAYDAAGNAGISSSLVVTVNNVVLDTTAPVVSAFTMPSTASALTVPVSSFTATDAVGVTGYLITESATAPAASAAGWTATAPTSFTFSAAGSKTAYAWAKDAAGNVCSSRSATVTITLPDTTAPVVSAFTMPSTASVLTVPVSSFTATDAVGVTGYLITESATAPAASAAGWAATAPTSFTFSAAGSKTAYAWAKDAAGNVSASITAAVTITLPDTTAPVVSAFTMPSTASALTVPISSFTATDAVGVTGYLITESATAPAASAAGWTATAPTSFTFSAAGSKTAYAWAKDAAGNVSASITAAVTITLPDTTAPVVSAFTMPSTASALTVPVSSFTATDAVGVTGYLITESVTAPAASAAGWAATAPTSFTFSAAGSKTAYAWAKDAAGNVSASITAAVTITLPDTTAPVVSAFTMPSTASALTVPVSSFTATDAVGVTGYLITESATAPAASAAGWTATAPTSFTFSAAGSKTAYAWAKDAAGNVSASITAAVTITQPDTTAPVVSGFRMSATATSLTVPITKFTATDAVGVTGYLITESATAPAASAAGWTATVPTSFSFLTGGSKTAYAWAKDAAGNVSASRSATVTITLSDTTAPVVSVFTMPSTSSALTVPVSSLTATDAVGVTGYLITESATAPAANATGWTTSAPTSFTFSAGGSKTAYAWAKDAVGNVSLSRSATVNITLPLDVSDALMALQISIGQVLPTSDQITRLDVAPYINGKSQPDGKVDVGDAIVILQVVSGQIVL